MLAGPCQSDSGKPGLGARTSRFRCQSPCLEKRPVGQFRGESRRACRPQRARAAGHRSRRAKSRPSCSATPAIARLWEASSTRSAATGPGMRATRLSGNPKGRSPWRSSADQHQRSAGAGPQHQAAALGSPHQNRGYQANHRHHRPKRRHFSGRRKDDAAAAARSIARIERQIKNRGDHRRG